jgi:cysteine-rich repeat protein
VCSLRCRNGLREVGEDCDDGNTIDGDGCTKCLIDWDYKCSGGSPTTIDVC